VMYNPLGLSREFVELRNITDGDVSVAGWRFTDGINFTFPAGASIAANDHVLVVPIDPATYRATYNVPASVQIFGPYTGLLNNSGEGITLSRPGTPVGNVAPYITVDRVNYDNDLPWPASPAGTGPSLGRVNPGRYGNDAANWRPDSANGTGGAANALPPVVMLSILGYEPQPTIRIKINKDLEAPLTRTQLAVVNLTTGVPLDLSTAEFNYDAATQTATWTLATSLVDGVYRATLPAAGIADSQGRGLDGNSDGTGGDNYAYEFHHLTGDGNGDRKVDHEDFAILYANKDQAGRRYTQGDFNFDGAVDFVDFQILELAFGKTLPEVIESAPAPVPVPVKPAPRPKPKPQPRPVPVRQPVSPPKVVKPSFSRRSITKELLA